MVIDIMEVDDGKPPPADNGDDSEDPLGSLLDRDGDILDGLPRLLSVRCGVLPVVRRSISPIFLHRGYLFPSLLHATN
jgi:hypothetical protein